MATNKKKNNDSPKKIAVIKLLAKYGNSIGSIIEDSYNQGWNDAIESAGKLIQQANTIANASLSQPDDIQSEYSTMPEIPNVEK